MWCCPFQHTSSQAAFGNNSVCIDLLTPPTGKWLSWCVQCLPDPAGTPRRVRAMQLQSTGSLGLPHAAATHHALLFAWSAWRPRVEVIVPCGGGRPPDCVRRLSMAHERGNCPSRGGRASSKRRLTIDAFTCSHIAFLQCRCVCGAILRRTARYYAFVVTLALRVYISWSIWWLRRCCLCSRLAWCADRPSSLARDGSTGSVFGRMDNQESLHWSLTHSVVSCW